MVDVVQIIRDNPIAAAAVGAAALGGGAAIAIGASSSASKKKRKTTKKLTARQKYVRKIKKRKGRQSPYTAGARKDRSTKRIRYTKNGQPYVLKKNGQAKFIKKSSAKRSHRQKGGRY